MDYQELLNLKNNNSNEHCKNVLKQYPMIALQSIAEDLAPEHNPSAMGVDTFLNFVDENYREVNLVTIFYILLEKCSLFNSIIEILSQCTEEIILTSEGYYLPKEEEYLIDYLSVIRHKRLYIKDLVVKSLADTDSVFFKLFSNFLKSPRFITEYISRDLYEGTEDYLKYVSYNSCLIITREVS